MSKSHGPLRVGIGGPVGSGKTALMDLLCKSMRERYDIAAITNDIYTKWDAEFLVRSGSLTPDRIAGVETGGCPHTAIREDASMNLAAVADMRAKFPDLDVVLIESGGDNLAATFSPELADLTIYVIDVAAGDKIPSKGGPGITRSDLLVINKIDLAPYVGASLEKMDTDARRMRGERPFVMTNLKKSEGLDRIIGFIETKGGLRPKVRAKSKTRSTKVESGLRPIALQNNEAAHHLVARSAHTLADPALCTPGLIVNLARSRAGPFRWLIREQNPPAAVSVLWRYQNVTRESLLDLRVMSVPPPQLRIDGRWPTMPDGWPSSRFGLWSLRRPPNAFCASLPT